MAKNSYYASENKKQSEISDRFENFIIEHFFYLSNSHITTRIRRGYLPSLASDLLGGIAHVYDLRQPESSFVAVFLVRGTIADK
jgi:hypothetical protein